MKSRNLLSLIFVLGSASMAQDTVRSPGWVVVPIREYEALRSKAYPAEREAEVPPVEATLTRVDYDLRIDGSVASGRASLTIDVLRDGWTRVPIPQGLLVRDAKLGGRLVSLVPSPGRPGQLSAILSRKGRSVLLLDVAFSVASASGEQRLALPAGASGVTRASIAVVPQQDVELKLAGGFMSEKSSERWLAYARGSEPLIFTWRKKIEERRVELPLRMRGSLTQLFGLGEDSTSLNAEVDIEVMQGAARQVRIAAPASLTINHVPGATVGDWDVQGGELVVNFLEPVERSAKFAISGETRLARDGPIAVPLLRLLGAERDTGGVAVEVLGAGEIKGTKLQGLESAEPAELSQMVASRQSPSLAAFRTRPGASARSLEVQVTRYAQQALLTANIEEARYRVLMTIEGKTLVQARYAVRNNQRNFVRVTLPAGASVWSSSLAGRPVRAGQASDGSLLFPLTKGRAGEEPPLFPIEILYLARANEWTSKGRAALTLPALDLPVSRTGLIVYYPPLFRVAPEPGPFHVQLYEKPASELLSTQAGSPPALESLPIQTPAPAPSSTQALVERYHARSDARRTAEASSTRVPFPSVGPSLFLVSELTAEGTGAVVQLAYQKGKKGSVK